MTSTNPKPRLIQMATEPDHNAISRFSDACARLDINGVVDAYDDLVATAPHRHDETLNYFVGHDGRPASGSHTNRIEEHLAIALVNDHPYWTIPNGHSVVLLDYQVPLKAKQSDSGIGKIDIFGISNDDIAVIIELKVLGKGRADTPLRALLEALAYAAIVEANASAFASEIAINTERRIASRRPDLVIAAPTDYWDYWFTKVAAGNWTENLGAVTQGLAKGLGIEIVQLDIGEPDLALGLHATRPHIVSGFHESTIATWSGRSPLPNDQRSTDR